MNNKKLEFCLFLIRLTVAAVYIAWAVMMMRRPDYIADLLLRVFDLSNLPVTYVKWFAYFLLTISIVFLSGIEKPLSYGLISLFQLCATIGSLKAYLTPDIGDHLVLHAGWPMLAACLTLFVLRDEDVLFSMSRHRRRRNLGKKWHEDGGDLG